MNRSALPLVWGRRLRVSLCLAPRYSMAFRKSRLCVKAIALSVMTRSIRTPRSAKKAAVSTRNRAAELLCEVEMPELQRASERYGSQGMTILAVNYHQTNTAEMRIFLNRMGIRFPGVYDPEGRIATAYGVAVGLPVSVFIDRSGKVVFIQVGQMSNVLLDDKVRSIL